MKKYKFVAAILAALMLAGVFASCASDTTKEKNKEKDDSEAEISSEEALEETSSANSEATESTESEAVDPESSEPVEETNLYQEGSYFDVRSDNESSAAQSYLYCMQKVEELHAQDPNLYFAFTNSPEAPWVISGTPDSTEDWYRYFITPEGDEMSVDCITPTTIYSYEEFISFPMAAFSQSPIRGELHPFTIGNSIDDGTYYAELLAISIDGTKALIVAKDPIILTSEEYHNLQPGERLTIADGDPLYEFDLTLSDDFDPNDPEFSSDSDDKYTFENCTFYFYEMENGNYILGSGENCQVYASMNPRLLIVDIAPDCAITDEFDTLENLDPTPYGYSDGINNMTKSYFYYYYSTLNSPIIYNDWININTAIKPCTIENNVITQMTLTYKDPNRLY